MWICDICDKKYKTFNGLKIINVNIVEMMNNLQENNNDIVKKEEEKYLHKLDLMYGKHISEIK